MFNSNLNGYYELRHLPQNGGFYEQESSELERILLIKRLLNDCITEKKEKEK